MLNPALEVHVLWHPADRVGAAVADTLAAHFHGGAYASLLAGSMDVYMRSAGWRSADDAPRPIAWPGTPSTGNACTSADFVAVVPLFDQELNRAANRPDNPWHDYLEQLAAAQRADPEHVQVWPLRIGRARPGGHFAELFGDTQWLAEPDPLAEANEPDAALRCRDLAQALAQWIGADSGGQLRVFISHTKHQGTHDEPVAALLSAVRSVFGAGRVAAFYDAHELQPGERWAPALRTGAASSALLALRTDLYASREWCQREMLIAKLHGMPVVVLDALSTGEARGSFLMDHTPRIPVRCDAQRCWGTAAIRRAVDLLADAWLQRVLWLRLQRKAAGHPGLSRYWWAPQAPEPSTLARWLSVPLRDGAVGSEAAATVDGATPPADPWAGADAPRMPAQPAGSALHILHPDPPLAGDEREVLRHLVGLAGYGALDLTTPRLLASRGA